MVPLRGFEPPTHALRMRCSTPELQRPAINILYVESGFVQYAADKEE